MGIKEMSGSSKKQEDGMAYIAEEGKNNLKYTIENGTLAFQSIAGMKTATNMGGVFSLKTEHGCFDERDAKGSFAQQENGLIANYAFAHGLTVQVHWIKTAGAIEREDAVIHNGTSPVTIFGYSAVTAISGQFDLYTQSNEWTRENQGQWRELTYGTFEISAHGARTCQGATPYMALKNTETGKGIGVHSLVSGDWQIRAEVASPTASPILLISTGPDESGLAYQILPGESAVFSRAVFLNLADGMPESGAAAFQRYLLADAAHKNPKTIPIEFNTWFYNFEQLDEDELLRQLDAAAELGCEAFTVDAGWYGQLEGAWHVQVGDWREKADGAFHGKMSEFADKVRNKGLIFGIWIEPERLAKNVPFALEHPEWFLPDGNGFLSPDLDREEAAQYTFDTIREIIERYNAGWVKIDFNHALGRDVHGIAHMGYLRQMWRMMDDVRAKYPNLILEGCSSGGMRFEAEAQKHFDVCFMSDTVNPWDVLRIGEGAALRILTGRVLRWCCLQPGGKIPHYGFTEPFTPLLTPKKAIWDEVENVDPDFLLKVCLRGHLSFSGEMAGLDERTKEQIKKAIAFTKKHRRLIQRGIFHPLTPIRDMEDRSGWSASYIERTQAASGEAANGDAEHGNAVGIFHAFRLDSPTEEMAFRLPPEAVIGRYVIEDYDTGETFEADAEVLAKKGIVIKLPHKNRGIVLVFHRK